MAAIDIYNIDDLKAIGSGKNGTGVTNADWNMSATYELKNNITINEDWIPLGNTTANAFKGTFNGNNNTLIFGAGVAEVNFTPATAIPSGLFGLVNGSTFNDLKIVVNNTTLNFTPAGTGESGIIVGRGVNGTMTFKNCHINFVGPQASVVSTYDNIGGFLGAARPGSELSFVDCTLTNGSITGSRYVGGFVGIARNISIVNSNATADVALTGSGYLGGLVGQAGGSLTTFTNANFTGNLSSPTNVTGGLVGEVRSNASSTPVINNTATFTNCHVKLSIFSNGQYSGGLIGRLTDDLTNGPLNPITTITGCTVRAGSISGTDYLGGLVGYSNADVTISNSNFTGNINGRARLGGLLGSVRSFDIDNSYAIGDFTGYGQIGGLVGCVGGALTDVAGASTMTKSYFEGNILSTGNDINSASGSFTDSGGLIGRACYLTDLSLSECYSTGSVVVYLKRAGGLIGHTVTQNATFIDDCYSTCSVYVYDRGLPGSNIPGTEDHSGYCAGGLVGIAASNKIYINNSYSAGSMVFAENGRAGGLIGATIDSTAFANPAASSTPTEVHIKDSYSLVSNVSSHSYAGPVIGDYDPTVPASLASTFSNVRVWNGMGGSNSSLFAASVQPVAREDVFNKYPTNWTTFSNTIWKASTSAYGLPIFKTPGMDNQPSGINPMDDINKGSSSGGGKGPGATINNNTSSGNGSGGNGSGSNGSGGNGFDGNGGNGTDGNGPGNGSGGNGSGNNSGGNGSGGNGSGNNSGGNNGSSWSKFMNWLGIGKGSNTDGTGGNGGVKAWFGNHKIMGYGGLLLVVVIIAGVAVYFVKFRGKDY